MFVEVPLCSACSASHPYHDIHGGAISGCARNIGLAALPHLVKLNGVKFPSALGGAHAVSAFDAASGGKFDLCYLIRQRHALFARQHLFCSHGEGHHLTVGATPVADMAEVVNANFTLFCHQRLHATWTYAIAGEAALDRVGIYDHSIGVNAKGDAMGG